jgi:Zn-finger nucleic acid-binding protein
MTTSPADPRSGVSCPECSKPCVPLNCGSVVVDLCRRCGGIWFDDREIGVFRAKLRKFDLTRLKASHQPSAGGLTSISACPRCDVVMDTFTYGVNTKVTPQRCAQCQGIWLDSVQLKAFLALARLSQEIEPHVRGVVEALGDEQREKEKWNRIGQFGDELNRTIRWRRWYGGYGLWDWILRWWY